MAHTLQRPFHLAFICVLVIPQFPFPSTAGARAFLENALHLGYSIRTRPGLLSLTQRKIRPTSDHHCREINHHLGFEIDKVRRHFPRPFSQDLRTEPRTLDSDYNISFKKSNPNGSDASEPFNYLLELMIFYKLQTTNYSFAFIASAFIFLMASGCSLKYVLAASVPWPIFSDSRVKKLPDCFIKPEVSPALKASPAFEIPSL